MKCPVCGGAGVRMGGMGRVIIWWRCRQCGYEYMSEESREWYKVSEEPMGESDERNDGK